MSTEIESSAFEQDIHCPLCDYNLRGLAEPRCPECGHRTTWEELRQRAALHPYLFEHHPRQNVRSFVRTVLGSMRPRSFWKGVSPTMRVERRRLLIFALICVLLGLLSSVFGASGFLVDLANRNATDRVINARYYVWIVSPGSTYDSRVVATVKAGIRKYGSISAYLWNQYPPAGSWLFWQRVPSELFMNRWGRNAFLRPAMIPLLWPVLSFASLLLFRATMRQAKIRNEHVLRCVIYSAAMLSLFASVLVVANLVDGYRPFYSIGYTPFGYVEAGYVLCLVFLALLSGRLVIAYRLYLRFPHAVAAVIASQIIVGLVLLKIDMILQGL
jgi:hypothetical protein